MYKKWKQSESKARGNVIRKKRKEKFREIIIKKPSIKNQANVMCDVLCLKEIK